MGDLLRNAAEFCVLATRGNPVILGGDQATVQRWPAQSLHSKKPPEFYGWIELVCPAPRYCSLFHRGPLRPGWGGFGDECGEVEQAEDEADEEE